ncbi:F-box domain-containing protein [Microsporum canis CBS 113480]|uniref:F-box domain-containing protein n=1 Tax=Arthroderma otae (strain ATCC MYA-4605 / CBS 113480) TaxID=554155 RepID=C5FL98_ARTOC|nr:F-box domain-containing protein [Microsporum canis CBS 113480]EEQ30470.1 F-box domain-containing protein [Microsporum canis CBS 113480]
MDKLPLELLRAIIDYLCPEDLANLQLVSQSLHTIARDNNVWRERCYQAQREYYISLRKRLALFPVSSEQLKWNNSLYEDPSASAATRWDPSDPEEDIDWYTEYIARHGPAAITWLQSPAVEDLVGRDRLLDVKGVGILDGRGYGVEDRAITLLEDGSVGIWDTSPGKAVMSSRSTVLVPDPSWSTSVDATKIDGITEGVSINSVSKRAYIAAENVINEVDLSTLESISQRTYPERIFALSQEILDYNAPLTIATRGGLHIYDPRVSLVHHQMDTSLSLEPSPSFLSTARYPTCCSTPGTANYTELLEPGPNFVLHPPSPNAHSIVVAGRFPSVLLYDRRNLGHLQASAHSGARLCGLAALPSIPKCYRTLGRSKPCQSIVACGEHKGMGSLELYALSAPETDCVVSPSPVLGNNALYRNRVSAARSKLLSVAVHGTRIVYSDSEGNIKWMERDGKTAVRTLELNTDSLTPGRTRKQDYEDTSYHVARKIIPTGGNLDHDGLIIWTGSRVGRLRFSSHVDEEYTAAKEELSDQEVRQMDLEKESWRNFKQSMYMRCLLLAIESSTEVFTGSGRVSRLWRL